MIFIDNYSIFDAEKNRNSAEKKDFLERERERKRESQE